LGDEQPHHGTGNAMIDYLELREDSNMTFTNENGDLIPTKVNRKHGDLYKRLLDLLGFGTCYIIGTDGKRYAYLSKGER
jgi:hypothetical protein